MKLTAITLRLPLWQRLGLVFLLALMVRMIVVFYFTDLNKRFEYQIIATNLVEGRGMSWDEWGRLPLEATALFPPLYIFWCSLFIWSFGQNFLSMFVVQAVVSATGVLPAFLVGREAFSVRTGWIFAILLAVYPEMAYLHARAAPEFLYVVCSLWLIYVYLRLKRLPPESDLTFRWSAVMGLIAGTGILLREGVAVVAGSCFAMLVLTKPFSIRQSIQRMVSRVVPALVVIVMVLTPWTVRNYRVQHHFIPVRTAYGMNLWMGNHEEATGTDRTADGGYQMTSLWNKNLAYYSRAMPRNEWDRSRFYREEALTYIKSHPFEYLRLTLTRLWYYVWFDPIHPLAQNIVYRAGYVLLLLVAVPGIVFAFRRRRLDGSFVLMYLGFMALYVPVIVLPRYRIIPVLLMLLMASAALNWAVESWRSRGA
jgi:4-amino-4-deoxy-L-arabinose transferase-like glycosyltransferase